jgi:hypothetical protein
MSFVRGLPGLVWFLAALSLPLVQLTAQNANDFDFKIEASKTTLRAGEQFTANTVVTTRCCAEGGGQGWSYGVAHDMTLIEITAARIGSDAEQLLSGGFNQTALSVNAQGQKLGFIQGYVVSFTQPIFIPITNRFLMAIADYTVVAGACGGQEVDKTTNIQYSSELRFGGGPPVDVNYTVDGAAVVPAVQLPAALTIACSTPQVETNLEMRLEPASVNLQANQTATAALDVVVKNVTEGQAGEIGAEAWSYAISLDPALLAIDTFALGADAASLKGGSGPDYEVHDSIDRNNDGQDDGVIAGAVLDLGKPLGNVLPLPVGGDKKIGRLSVKSSITLSSSDPNRNTPLEFVVIQGDDQVSTIEILFTIDQESVVPETLRGATVTLQGVAGAAGRFLRADANNDRRIDIADGIWIIQFLFYGGMRKPCVGAADANDDNRVDISDAMFIINYQLQPGRTPGNLYPRPPAPFPDCGTDADLTAADCPIGSTFCDA